MPNCVVTGATKGIGRALVEAFAQAGFNVLFCARTASDVQAFQADLSSRYPQQRFIGLVADLAQAQAFAPQIAQHFDSVQVLVNNAGVFKPCQVSQSDEASQAVFRLMMDTNLYSAYYVTHAVLPLMPKQAKAHIFNLCSIASFMPYSGYSVSKFALLGYSKVLREELKPQGIRVTAVMPGATLTDSWAGVSLPQERFMPAEDIAQAVLDVYGLSERTVVEELILRPQLGDI